MVGIIGGSNSNKPASSWITATELISDDKNQNKLMLL